MLHIPQYGEHLGQDSSGALELKMAALQKQPVAQADVAEDGRLQEITQTEDNVTGQEIEHFGDGNSEHVKTSGHLA